MSATHLGSISLQKSFEPRAKARADETAKQRKTRIRVRRPHKQKTSGGNLVYAGYPYDPYA